MKYLLHRTTALLLALLLLFSAGSVFAFAAQTSLPDPACVLGTTPSAMLAGGGRQVHTDQGDLILRDEDGAICRMDRLKTPLVEGPASRLNYLDGVLYFAREGEESFDLCAYDLEKAEETVLLAQFAGRLGQLYAVDGDCLMFSCGNAVWRLELDSLDYRVVRYVEDLRSFVPTGCGLLYTTGALFDYSLYADGQLLAEHVDSYYVDFDRNDELVYAQNGGDYQMDLTAAFGGVAVPAAFTGCDDYTSLAADVEEELTPEEALAEFQQEAERLAKEHDEIVARYPGIQEGQAAPPDPADADPNDPQLPEGLLPEADPEETEEEPTETAPVETEPAAPVETEPAAPAETEPAAPVETEPAETEPAAPAEPEPNDAAGSQSGLPIEDGSLQPGKDSGRDQAPTVTGEESTKPSGTGSASVGEAIEVVEPPVYAAQVFSGSALRATVTTGQQNIVRRARQVLNIQWTPVKSFGGWGYYDSSYGTKIWYSAGTTYRGVPYGQGMVYVPWSASLTDFIAAVKNSGSKLYTTRNTVSRGSQYYGTDCSGFVSWCWNLSRRTLNNNTSGMAQSSISTRVGKDYTMIQIGDALINENSSWSHSRLVTDVTYKSDGVTIDTIEISEANPTTGHTGCCYSTRYSGSSLSSITAGKYAIYRSNSRGSAKYTHECVVPLDGDYCTVCGAGVGGGDDSTPDVNKYIRPGIDVSYAQGTVSWNTVAPLVDFAILRIGYTGSLSPTIGKDSYFDANVAGCEANNIPYGIYFYAGATTEEQAVQEAEAVIDYLGVMSGSGHIPALPIFYDVEQNNNILSLDNTKLLSVITAFCSTIENFGFRAGVYASTNVWNTRLTHSAYNHWARWVAQWGSNSMTAAGGANVWQYDNKGSLAGISTNVDLDYWIGTVGNTEHPSTASITSPGCATEGKLSYSCVSCGQQGENPISPLGHVYSGGICLRCGHKQTSAARFIDVPVDKYYSTAVYWAVAREITVGTSENTFSPYANCTRSQILTFIWRANGLPEPKATTSPFLDVTEEKYFFKPVLWAMENGMTSGITETLFGPNESCTRGQAVYFLWRAAGSPEPERENMPFKDVTEEAYYYKAVLWAKQNCITAGTSETTFSPGATCSRAQIVTFLYTVYHALNDENE